MSCHYTYNSNMGIRTNCKNYKYILWFIFDVSFNHTHHHATNASRRAILWMH